MEGTYLPVAVQIITDDETMAELTARLSGEQDVTLSPVRAVSPGSDLNFDLETAKQMSAAVTAVVTAVRSGKQIIDWLLPRIRSTSKPIVIKIGKDRLEISADSDPETTRKLLEAAMHLV